MDETTDEPAERGKLLERSGFALVPDLTAEYRCTACGYRLPVIS